MHSLPHVFEIRLVNQAGLVPSVDVRFAGMKKFQGKSKGIMSRKWTKIHGENFSCELNRLSETLCCKGLLIRQKMQIYRLMI
jgi:hypothetical protein